MIEIFKVIIEFVSKTIFPDIFFGIIFLIAVFFYIKKYSFDNVGQKYKKLIFLTIIFRLFYAILLTGIQYYVWTQSEFTKIMIDAPTGGIFNGKYGYFLFYSFGRFWLNTIILIVMAYVFYLFLIFLKKYRERFFDEGEIELGFLAVLIVGWPNFVIFMPFVFMFVVLISIFKMIFLKEHYTTLGLPFILAMLTALIFGNKLAIFLNLGFLKV